MWWEVEAEKMIEIKKDVEYYRIGAAEKENILKDDEKKLDKFGKMKKKMYETILDLDEKIEDVERVISSEKKERENGLLQSIVSIVDLYDEADRFFYHTKESDLKAQFEKQRQKMEGILTKVGITKIDHTLKNRQFDSQLHKVIENRGDDITSLEIIELVNNGYLYQGGVIRKAEVILGNVDKINNEVNDDEEYCGN